MTIHSSIPAHYPELNNEQREVIAHSDGALLIIAGPGSGKTHSIVLRALNLLLLEKAKPEEVVLCTFTEKAALEMRERLTAAALRVGYKADLSDLKITTIHGFCNRVLMDYRHHIDALGNNFNTLDDLTQQLFISQHFKEIVGHAFNNGRYFGRWLNRWQTIKSVQGYFDKITDELVDVERLVASSDEFIHAIGTAYQCYEEKLAQENRVDFAHLQKYVYNLLQDEDIAQVVTGGIRYLMVDEYQDTNYVQEQLIIKLTENSRNLCVVGDEDQSIYRFRGSTVRNIMEFPKHFPDCRQISLTTNYRSHCDIVKCYDSWMKSAKWGRFRYDKTIEANPNGKHNPYLSVFSIYGNDKEDEAERFAQLVEFLKEKEIISDYRQVALLLHSVRDDHSAHYIKALRARGIPAYCPRARGFFDIWEIRMLVACYALLLGWHGDKRDEVLGSVADLAKYVDCAINDLAISYGGGAESLAQAVREWGREIDALQEDGKLTYRVIDYFYRMISMEPFVTAMGDENTARNVAIFSNLLITFQEYYRYAGISYNNRISLKRSFFASFLRLLYEGGINEYEDHNQPFPKGHVQIMTIHQAKGLEFPVVVAGSLSVQISTPRAVDGDLAAFYHRGVFEPEDRLTEFDRMRLHYVAVSRAQNVLVLTAHRERQLKPHVRGLYQGLDQWPHVAQESLAMQRFSEREWQQIKRTYSFTSDLTVYETCPRLYQFFREYEFSPARVGEIFFGLLVHNTIEDIHRTVRDDRGSELSREKIREFFDRAFMLLSKRDIRPINEVIKERAFGHVMNYYNQNKAEMQRVWRVEEDVSLEKEDYILTGKVDLMLNGDDKLEILDFKTSKRPQNGSDVMVMYERQLCTYAHIMEQRHGKKVDKLFIYWTSEEDKGNALMEVPYNSQRAEEAGQRFDRTVQLIQNKEFAVRNLPDRKVCSSCDFRRMCIKQRIIPPTIPDDRE